MLEAHAVGTILLALYWQAMVAAITFRQLCATPEAPGDTTFQGSSEMINIILFTLLLAYACILTWWYFERDAQWINVCHTLGVSSRTHPRDVQDK